MAEKKPQWANIRIPKGLLEEIERFIKQSKGAYTSKADFVKTAIREKLTREEDILIARDIISKIAKKRKSS